MNYESMIEKIEEAFDLLREVLWSMEENNAPRSLQARTDTCMSKVYNLLENTYDYWRTTLDE